MIVIIIAVLAIVLISVWLYLKSCHQYWQRRGIPYLKPTFIFGNAKDLLMGRKSILENFCSLYEGMKSTKLMGAYMLYKPVLYISDVNWIENILRHDFRHFTSHGIDIDEPLSKHIFHLEGPEWKDLRVKIRPAFKANGVRSLFFSKLLQSCTKLIIYFDDILTRQTDLDMKDIFSRYTADVIGLCAFGTDSGALGKESTEFYRNSLKTCEPRVRSLIKLMIPNLPNFILEFFDIKMITNDLVVYFSDTVRKELEKRRQQPHEGHPNDDFPEFMMKLQQNNSEITDNTIIAHCFMFFMAGFENATATSIMTVLELADHPEIQEKLFEEIERTCVTSSGTLDVMYDKLDEMEYLDKVMYETLRLYPLAMLHVRQCTKDYILPGSSYRIEKGTQILIPYCGINRDPQFFPYAAEFNPENFSEEAKAKRNPSVFIPFGSGPRMCVAKEFAVTQLKLVLIFLVHNFVFYPSPKLEKPFKFQSKGFLSIIEGGGWMRAEPRTRIPGLISE